MPFDPSSYVGEEKSSFDPSAYAGSAVDTKQDSTQSEAKKKKPFVYRDENGLLHIGENLLDLSKDGLIDSTLMNLPGAAAGAAATGQAIKATEGLRASPSMPLRAIGTLGPLAYGAVAGGLAGLGVNKGLEKFSPETKKSIDEELRKSPDSEIIGSLAANAPFFGIGPLEKSVMEAVRGRAIPAAIGAGMAGAQQLATQGQIDPASVAEAGLTNAIFNKPTRLGEAAMDLGARFTPSNKPAITPQLGNASTKGSIGEANAAANSIALEPAGAPQPVQTGTNAAFRDPETGAIISTKNEGLGMFEPTPQDMTLAKGVADAQVSHETIEPAPLQERAAALSGLAPQQAASDTLLADILRKMKDEPHTLPAGTKVEDKKNGWSIKLGDKPQEVASKPSEQEKATETPKAEDNAPNASEIGKDFNPEAYGATPVEDLGYEPKAALSKEVVKEAGPETPAADKPEYPLGIKNGKIVDAFDREVTKTGDRYELVTKSSEKPAEAPAPEPAPEVAKIEPAKTPLDEAIGRKNLEQGGRLIKGGTGEDATPENVAAHVKRAEDNIAERKAVVEMLESEKEANPKATVPEIRKFLPADSGFRTWDEAIDSEKYLIKDAEQYIADVKTAGEAYVPPEPIVKKKIAGNSPKDVAEMTAVVAGDKKVTIFRSKKDGNWYDANGNLLSQGSRQMAIQKVKDLAKIKSNKGGVLDPRPALDALSEPEGNRPTSIFERFAAGETASKLKTEPDISFPQPGVGRSPDKAMQKSIREVSHEKDLLPTKDSIRKDAVRRFGKDSEQVKAIDARLEQNRKDNAKAIYERLKNKSKENGNPPPPESVGYHIDVAPDEFKPLLTDIASRFPFIKKVPLGEWTSDRIGDVAKFLKNQIGVLETNIQERNQRAFGALRDLVFRKNDAMIDYEGRVDPLGKLSREYLTPDEFINMEAAKLSGDEERIKAIIGNKPKEQADKLMAAYDANIKAKAEIRDRLIVSGRDVGEVDTYFNRKLIDRDGLLKAIGSDGIDNYRDALNSSAKSKGKTVAELTDDEKDQILNNLIAGSFRGAGKPGFMKQRVIDEITPDLLKYYEPSDVADHDYVSKAVRDIFNREAFGKHRTGQNVDEAGHELIGGSFGKILREEVEAGRLNSDGFKVVQKAFNDYFTNSVKYDEDLGKVANMLRRGQTYLYLADISTALPQFGDYFNAMAKYGIQHGTTGFFNRKFGLDDIRIHEGISHDLQEFQRKGGPGLVGKVYGPVLRRILGTADAIGKSGIANAAFRHASDVVRSPESKDFRKMDREYTDAFGRDRWNQILTDLRSDDFKNGKLNDNTRFFLFNELSNLQPIDASGRAQGYNSATPMGKLLYALRSFAIKQVDYIRREAYMKMKDRHTFGEGFKNAAAYLMLVGAGQQVLSYAKDKAFGRETDPAEYAINGAFQLMMIPKFAIMKFKQEGAWSALSSTLIPGAGFANDLTKDAMLGAAFANGQVDSKGNRTVEDIPDFLKQLRTVQYLPAVGREAYWWWGRGHDQEIKRQAQSDKGHPQEATYQLLEDIINPPDLKSARKQ